MNISGDCRQSRLQMQILELMSVWNAAFSFGRNSMKEQVKKWIIMIESLLLIFLIFFWCGTNMVSENGDHGEAAGTVEEAWRQDAKYLSVMAMEKEFFELIAGNPIDRTFEWKDVSTEDKIRQAVAYKELWEAEIEYTFDILEGYLSEQDFAILKQAHEEWKVYMEHTTEIEKNIYYPGMEYGIGGSLTYPHVMETVGKRTKFYAIQLMALEYSFTGGVEFCTEEVPK